MKKKFNTRVSVLIAALGMVVMAGGTALSQTPPKTPPAATAPLQLADNAPTRYEVKKGDTLWSIAGRFLKSPWRWNELWRLNKDQIRNPHRIFPGEVLVLTSGADGQPQLNIAAAEPERETIRVPLQVRSTPIVGDEIPSIPPAIIDPFLTRPLVVEANGLDQAPRIVGAAESRVVLAPGYKIYAAGMTQSDGRNWQIYRPGKALFSPGRPTENLGFEAEYLGDAAVDQFGEISTLVIQSSRKEIVVGDRLVPVAKERIISYPPHSPEKPVSGRIIGLPTSIIESGRDAVITLDVGAREGVEIGHVLALYHDPGKADLGDKKQPWYAFATTAFAPEKNMVQLPQERIGLAFVFRVFDKVSYALVLNTTKQVELGDQVRKP